MSVQELIDALNAVEDKSRGITVYLSSNDSRIRGVLEVFGFAVYTDEDILKDDKDCNDVVLGGVVDSIQLSAGCRDEE